MLCLSLIHIFKAYPQEAARRAESEEQVLSDPEVKLVASACITSERAALGDVYKRQIDGCGICDDRDICKCGALL